jgi:hypothetical protein
VGVSVGIRENTTGRPFAVLERPGCPGLFSKLSPKIQMLTALAGVATATISPIETIAAAATDRSRRKGARCMAAGYP